MTTEWSKIKKIENEIAADDGQHLRSFITFLEEKKLLNKRMLTNICTEAKHWEALHSWAG